jgi:hypothetical protein
MGPRATDLIAEAVLALGRPFTRIPRFQKRWPRLLSTWRARCARSAAPAAALEYRPLLVDAEGFADVAAHQPEQDR